jgi:peroxiredoxin Q/BCP
MKKRWMVVAMLLGLAAQAAPPGQLMEGQPAPDFRAPSTAGADRALADYAGRWLVLYFYPKSFTGGCTRQACSLRDGMALLGGLKAAVLGASPDDLETQQRFKEAERLPFDLLADHDARVAAAYKILDAEGRYQRRTIIVSPAGKVAYIFYRVNVDTHAEDVAAVLRKLQEPNLKMM